MASAANDQTTLHVNLNVELTQLVEQAATHLGQTANEFALATLTAAARNVLAGSQVTELSDRDRDLFCRLLDDVDAEPNDALLKAAQKYKDELG